MSAGRAGGARVGRTQRPAREVVRCSRCRARTRVGLPAAAEWNVVFDKGVLVGFLCGACQTPEENAEAVINEATLDYGSARWDAFGRLRVRSRTD